MKVVFLLLVFCRLLESKRRFVLKIGFDVPNSDDRDSNVHESDVRDSDVCRIRCS